MEKYIQVMQQAAELTDTMVEGLKHAQRLYGEGHFEQANGLFEQVIVSFTSIEKALIPIKDTLVTSTLEEKINQVMDALNLTLDECESANYPKVQEILQFNLVPQVQKWQKELLQAFEPYTAS